MLSYTTTDNTSPTAIIANTAYTTGRAVSPVVAPSPDSVDGAVAASPVLPSALPLLELSGVVGCVGTVGTVGVSPLLLSSLPGLLSTLSLYTIAYVENLLVLNVITIFPSTVSVLASFITSATPS